MAYVFRRPWPFRPRPKRLPYAQAAVQHNLTITATCTTTTSVAKQVGKILAATSTTTTTFQNQVGKLITATCTTSFFALKQVYKVVSATQTTAASVVKAIVKQPITMTSTTSVALSKQVNKVVTATVTTLVSYIATFIGYLDITDTINFLLKPINAVLAGDQDNFEESFRQDDVRNPDIREETGLSGGGLTQLSESASSFTVKTDHRGYD